MTRPRPSVAVLLLCQFCCENTISSVVANAFQLALLSHLRCSRGSGQMRQAIPARARRAGHPSLELPSTEWYYEFVPVHTLPTIDLSKSLKSQLLSPEATQRVVQFLTRYRHLLSALYSICLALNIAVPLMDAPTGRTLAICGFVCGLPLALGSIASLRYDVLKLLVRTYDFWFYALVHCVTYGAIIGAFRDARIGRVLIDSIGFQNMVLIDAQLLGVRKLIGAGTVAIGTISILLACVVVNEVDQVDFTHAVLHYQTPMREYTVTVGDVVTNGLVTMIVLLLKIVYRKRSALQRRRVAAAAAAVASTSSSHSGLGGSVVECAIYRCRVQLVPVQPSAAAAQVIASVAANPAVRVDTRAAPLPGSSLQQMHFVDHGIAFDARRTMLPIRIESHTQFPLAARVVLYTAGVLGALCNSTTVTLAVQSNMDDRNLVATWCAALAFVLSAIFTTACAALYQRELLASLLTSFDFFYALHFACMHMSICVLYRRDRAVVCVSVTALLWALWLLTLDALTPVIRAKLHFHVRYAIPIVALGAAIHTVLLAHLLSDAGPRDVVVWEGGVLTHHLQVRVIPFYISRFVTLVPWFLRVMTRLLRASNCDAIILRASVTYQHRSRDQHHGVTPLPASASCGPAVEQRGLSANAVPEVALVSVAP